VYDVSGRGDLHEAIARAIVSSGGEVLYASPTSQAPFYFGVQTDRDERLGLLIYPFRATKRSTDNRPADEVRGQIRMGGEKSWNEEHPIAMDMAGVDTTLVLVVDPESGAFIGLDPNLWNPLPMGISMYVKDAELDAMGADGWHVWEKDNRAGSKRDSPRSESGLETLVAFRPDRLLDYVRFERRAIDLGLDTPLRFTAAQGYRVVGEVAAADQRHILEDQFNLSSAQILEIILSRNRLSVAVRGGVAEHHLQSHLQQHPDVVTVESLDRDAEHDFNVTFRSGKTSRIECKNVSPHKYASGEYKVETQKTRASKGDPASRFYPVDRFDLVAACLYSATGNWEFRFAATSSLLRHADYPDRLAALQRVGDVWSRSLTG